MVLAIKAPGGIQKERLGISIAYRYNLYVFHTSVAD